MVISDLQYKLIFSGMVVGVPDSALRGLTLVRIVGPCSLAKHFAITVPLFVVELGQMIVRAAALI